MAGFGAMKKKGSQLASLREKVEKSEGNDYGNDDNRLWNLARDKANNGHAVIRFLPPTDGEDVPYVKLFNHFFKNDKTDKWYVENSLTTIGENDPVGELNSALWKAGNEDQARKQKRRLNYYSNIYIIKDPANPENEGKVMIFRYGKVIFDKLMESINPAFEDDTPFNPFDLWEGADFKMRVRMKDKYINYDDSAFVSPAPLLGDDEELETIWNFQHKLQEFISPDKFKTYDELQKALDIVMGNTSKPTRAVGKAEDNVMNNNKPTAEKFANVIDTAKEEVVAEKPIENEAVPETTADSIDDAMAFFDDLGK